MIFDMVTIQKCFIFNKYWICLVQFAVKFLGQVRVEINRAAHARVLKLFYQIKNFTKSKKKFNLKKKVIWAQSLKLLKNI